MSTRAHSRPSRLLGVLAGASLLAACGGGGGSVTSEGGGSSSGSASASVVADAGCPETDGPAASEAERTVEVTLTDHAISLDPETIDAGVTTFAATNEGGEAHELAFLPGGGEVPLTADGEPDEEALAAAGAFELEAFAPGQTCEATYDLDPGTYTLFCIVESPDGETHAEKGMVTTLEVS